MDQQSFFPNDKSGIMVPVISLWQPWASAVVTPHPEYPNRGIKEYETRHFTTTVRGRILIHAAKKWDKENRGIMDFNAGFMRYRGFMGTPPLGAIIGSVIIEGMITSESFHESGQSLSKTANSEFYLGNWEPNRFGWKLKEPILFKKPIPYKGQQGFWKVPLSIIDEQYHTRF